MSTDLLSFPTFALLGLLLLSLHLAGVGAGVARPDPRMTVATSYRVVRPGRLIDRQKHLSDGVILDLDDHGAVVGIETIGEHSDAEVLALVLDKAQFG